MVLERELSEAKRLAREAGRYLLSVDPHGLPVAYKSVGNPVTEADERANAFIVEALRRAFPADAVVAEESHRIEGPARPDRAWYVDPLDGTKEFLAGTGDFAVMIGLAIEGRATLGVVFDPTRDRLYAGIVGEGATLAVSGVERPIAVGSEAAPAALRLVQSRARRASITDRLARRLEITRRERRGSMGIKACLVAAGEADLYVSLSNRSRAWDSCGPEAIVRAAGGRFVDLTGRDVVYDPSHLRNLNGLMASNAACFEAVLPEVRAVAEGVGLA